MKGFIINLDRSKDRLTTFEQRLFELGFTRVCDSPLRWQKGTIEIERLAGVEGKKLSTEEANRYRVPRTSAFWDWTTHQLTLSEIGCYLSHCGAWKKVVEEKLDYAFILEDDLLFTKEILEFLSTPNWIPSKASFVKLDFSPVNEKCLFPVSVPEVQYCGRKVVRTVGRTYGAGFYILSFQSAVKAIKQSEFLRLPVDLFLFDARFEFSVKQQIYCVFPALAAYENDVPSTIGNDRNKETLTFRQHILKGFYSLARRWRLKRLMKKYHLHWEKETCEP